MASLIGGAETALAATGACTSPLPYGTPPPAFTLDFTPLNQGAGATLAYPPACMNDTSVYSDNNTANEKKSGETWFLLQNNPDHNTDPTYSQLPQIVTDGTYDYYHIIMDDSAAGGMKLEYYIQMGYASIYSTGTGNGFEPTPKWNANYASHITAGNWASASGGDGIISLSAAPRKVLDGGNSWYPLQAPAGKDDGNGSGNPNRVIIRQELQTTDLQQSFLKSNFANKALITQTTTSTSGANTMTSLVRIDMTNSTYSQNSLTPNEFTNTVTFSGPDAFLNTNGAFDYATDTQTGHANVTAGQYTYTEGSGPGGSNGTYSYSSGNFDVQAVDWASYFDANLANPWGCQYLATFTPTWGCPNKPR